MMFLTENQSDALTEVINIAFSRAAASLSEITGFLVMVLGVSSLQILLDELDKLG